MLLIATIVVGAILIGCAIAILIWAASPGDEDACEIVKLSKERRGQSR